MSTTTVTLHGLAGISANLAKVRDSLRRSLVRSALKEAAKPIEEDMRRRLPRKTRKKGSTGALRNSIGTVYKSSQGGRVSHAYIGPKTKQSMPRMDLKSVRTGRKATKGFTETTITGGEAIEVLKGKTKKVKIYNLRRRKGKSAGKVQVNTPTRYAHLVENGFLHRKGNTLTRVAPKPFMRPAWQAEGGNRALDRFINRLARDMT